MPKAILLGCLLVIVAAGAAVISTKLTSDNSSLPIRRVTVDISDNMQEPFFSKLREFSDRSGFAIRIAPVDPDGEHFLIQMWRTDLRATGTNPFERQTYIFYFHESIGQLPPDRYVDALLEEFEVLVGEAQGITVSIGRE